MAKELKVVVEVKTTVWFSIFTKIYIWIVVRLYWLKLIEKDSAYNMVEQLCKKSLKWRAGTGPWRRLK